MSEHVRTRSQSSERGNDEESSQPVEPVIVQQPTEEKRQEEEPPTETQGVAPSGEIENEGAPAVQGPDVEALQQELALLTVEDELGDGPDVREGILPTFDLTEVLEAVFLLILRSSTGLLEFAGGPLQTLFTLISPVEAAEQQRLLPASSPGNFVSEEHWPYASWISPV
ncbi:putative G antigen family E member 3 [Saimiri boliviensis]|uniref:putative G antigen family E member 3 n=1 Tax=Saimiri boliviensis TaxID=27679 RepID=UPI003D76ECE0